MALIEYRVVQRFLEIRISKGGIEFMGLLLKIKQIQFNSTLYHMNKFQIDFIEKKIALACGTYSQPIVVRSFNSFAIFTNVYR